VTRAILLALGLLLASPASAGQPGEGGAAAAAATAWLDLLTPAQRRRGHLPYDDPGRLRWNFGAGPRPGVSFAEMDEAQSAAAEALFGASLAGPGAEAIRTVRILQGVLRDRMSHGQRRAAPFHRNPLLYFVAVFGTPGPEATWGWRVEGNNLSLNLTYSGARLVSTAPGFVGAEPDHVPEGEHEGLRFLSARQDLARELAACLDPRQLERARPDRRPPPAVFFVPGTAARGVRPEGLPLAAMTEEQRDVFWRLVEEHLAFWPAEHRSALLEEAKASPPESVRFLWLGGIQIFQRQYHCLHGPTFLFEFLQRGGARDTLWRDPRTEFAAPTR
jgi:hypothetical protein